MIIRKMGKVIEFTCRSCEGTFAAGINTVQNSNGNYYCKCPMCGSECYTNVAEQAAEKHKDKGE